MPIAPGCLFLCRELPRRQINSTRKPATGGILMALCSPLVPPMKRLALLFCLLLCLPLAARADDATKRAKVQEMLDLQHLDRTMDQIMKVLETQATAATNAKLNGRHATPEQKARIDAFQKQLFDYIGSQVSWESMRSDYIDLYAQTFTEDEIDGMLTFYKSPAGAAMIAKTPELAAKAGLLGAKRMLTLKPEIQKMVDDFASTEGKQNSNAVDTN